MKKVLAFSSIAFFYATMFVSCTNAEQSKTEAATGEALLTASEK